MSRHSDVRRETCGQSEEPLRKSEETFRSLFREMSEGFALHEIILDSSGKPCDYRFVEVNPAFEKQTGLKRADVIGRTVKEILPDTEEYWIETYGKVALTGEPIRFENYSRELDRHYSVTAYSPGKGRFAVLFFDITQRKKTEEQLTHYQLLAQHGRDIVLFVRRRDGRIMEANDAAMTAYGRSRDELLSMTITDLRAPSGRHLTESQMDVADSSGILFETEHCRRDGTPFPVEVSSRGISLDGERVLLSIIRDITERRKSEEALREAERKYRDLVRYAPAAIYEIDFRSRRFTAVNDAMCSMLGYSREELLAMDSFELLDEDGRARSQTRIRKWLNGEDPGSSVEYDIRTKSGHIICVLLNATVVADKDGKPLGATVIGHDITDRKRAEQALQRQHRSLQQALLPSAPKIGAGYRLASRYLPAYEGQDIGGDFYDVFRTEAGKVGVVLGDVSGKGIEAASTAAATRSTIRAFAYELSSPAHALTHTNSVMAATQGPFGRFVTVFVAVLDPDTGDVCYASAGHPPALLMREGGGVEMLTYGDMPIGVADSLEYHEYVAKLEPGDRMVLYTDGVTEARRDSKLFGVDGLVNVLTEHRSLAPDDLVNEILNAASDWAEGKLLDDTAIILIERESQT